MEQVRDLFGLQVGGEEVGNDVAQRTSSPSSRTSPRGSPSSSAAGGSYKAGRQWQKKEFLDRIIVSLNIFADGDLKIRTVLERSLDEVFLNQPEDAADAVMQNGMIRSHPSAMAPE